MRRTVLKLGILATHPIQYHAPLFRELAQLDGVDVTVYFCHRPTPTQQGEGFGVAFEWDLDLLSGYRHVFLHNMALRPTQGFFGYDTPEITGIIRREKFDFFIVHGWAWKGCWQAFRTCWTTGTKLGVRSDSQLLHENIRTRQRLKAVIKKLSYPLFIRHFDVCLPYGRRSADYFRHYGGRNIVIAPHSVDNDLFASKTVEFGRQREKLRRQWRIPDDAFCFLFCGKLQQKKRPMDILRALHLLVARERHDGSQLDISPIRGSSRPFHLLMVGDGELRAECERYLRIHGLPVTFVGFLNQGEIPKAYAAADCLVLSSSSEETWGLVVNEAMACGLPPIVSDACGCVPDLIRNGETGYSFPCGDIRSLSERMRQMLEDGTGWKALRDGALRHIMQFSVVRAAEAILEAARHA